MDDKATPAKPKIFRNLTKAREAKECRAQYKIELSKARTNAIRLANKIIEKAIDGAINKDVLDAMSEVLRDARTTLDRKHINRRRNYGTGIPDDAADDARRLLEGEPDKEPEGPPPAPESTHGT